ncbi:MAG: glycosyltransferase family 2 protein [Planctomycetota bacterium]
MSRAVVIIPHFNDLSGLGVCLRALDAQTLEPARWSVIVVDNGSRDDQDPSELVAGYAQARLIREPKPGSYAARNRAIREAGRSDDVLVFTDSDCLPEPGWLEHGLAGLSRGSDARVLAGHVEVEAKDPKRMTPAEVYERVWAFRQDVNVRWYHYGVTANLFVPRGVLDRVGGFDEEQLSGGDRAFGNTLKQAGVGLVYGEHAVVRHPARRSLSGLLRKRRRVIGGVVRLEVQENRSGWRHDLGFFIPTPRRLLAGVRSDRLTRRRDRLVLVFVNTLMLYTTAWERVRLRLGGRPLR